MKLLISSILFFLFSTLSFCQTGNEISLLSLINSLKEELYLETEQTKRVDILIQIAQLYSNYNIDSSFYYADRSLKTSKEIDYIHGKVGAISFNADVLINMGNLPKAMELSLSAVDMAKDIPVRIAGIGAAYDNIGNIYFIIGDYSRAREFYDLEVSLGEDDVVGVAFGYLNIAALYQEIGQLDTAMLFLEKSYKAFSRVKYIMFPTVYPVYPGWYNLRAKVYVKKNIPDLALNDLNASLNMTLTNDDHTLTADTYNDLAGFYQTINKPDSAIFYAEQAMKYARKTVYSKGILDASSILSEQFEEIDPGKAVHYYKIESETRNSLYGAGNIQAIRDMIAQNEAKQREIETAKLESRNRIRLNTLLGSLFTLLIVAILLYRNNRTKQKAKQEIEKAYTELKDTQSQLIHSEKMASLGELTAGIAHEIQNPLNFVKNFSEVSEELAAELNEELEKGDIEEAKIISKDVSQNLQKISHHGKRASDIVKSMLEHSRTGENKKEPTDINKLADEYLRLAYHGLRAKDSSFQADFTTNLEDNLPLVNVVPQDIGRVLLNLINNAFYAVDQKAKEGKDEFKPKITVSTKSLNNQVKIIIADNGNGIPEHVRDKIFQPFFTTKPTGSGTGLGLSMSYDIITKGHGGEIKVDGTEGHGTTFSLSIPFSK